MVYKCTLHLFSIAFVILFFCSCTEIPSISEENPVDPYSKNYIPSRPSNLIIKENSTNGLQLSWDNTEDDLVGISGYEIYLDKYNTGNFQLIKVIDLQSSNKVTNQTTTRFYQHPFEEDVLQYKFGIVSFFETPNNVVKSDTSFIDYNNLLSVDIDITAYPFNINPYYETELIIYKNDKFALEIELYSTDSDSIMNLIYSTIFNGDYINFNFPLNVETNLPNFYYKFKRGSSSTDLYRVTDIGIYEPSYEPYHVPNIRTSSSDQLTLSFGSDSLYFDELDVTIKNTETEEIYSGSVYNIYEEIVLNGLDPNDILVVNTKGKRGVFETQRYFSEVESFPIKTSEHTVYTSNLFEGNSSPSIEIDEEFGFIYLTDKSSFDWIFNINTSQTKNIIYYEERTRIGKFLSNRVTGLNNSILFNTYEDSTFSKFEISNNIELNETKYDAIDGYIAYDIEIISENELIIVNLKETDKEYEYDLIVTHFNTNTQLHTKIVSSKAISKSQTRIKYDESNNRLFLLTSSGSWFPNSIFEIDLTTNKVVKSIDTGISGDYFFDPDILYNGAIISYGNFENFRLFSTSTGEKVYDTYFSYPFNGRSLNTTESNVLMCESYHNNRFNSNHITCGKVRYNIFHGGIDYISPYYEFENFSSELYTTNVSESGNLLALLFSNELKIIRFEHKWKIN